MNLVETSSGTPQLPFKAPSFTSYILNCQEKRSYPNVGKCHLGTVDFLLWDEATFRNPGVRHLLIVTESTPSLCLFNLTYVLYNGDNPLWTKSSSRATVTQLF